MHFRVLVLLNVFTHMTTVLLHPADIGAASGRSVVNQFLPKGRLGISENQEEEESNAKGTDKEEEGEDDRGGGGEEAGGTAGEDILDNEEPTTEQSPQDGERDSPEARPAPSPPVVDEKPETTTPYQETSSVLPVDEEAAEQRTTTRRVDSSTRATTQPTRATTQPTRVTTQSIRDIAEPRGGQMTTPTPANPASSSQKQGSCNFGENTKQTMCAWHNHDTTALMWQSGIGSDSNWIGGPKRDFDSKDSTGGYVFLETSQSMPKQSRTDSTGAMLESPLLRSTGPKGACFVFRYAIDGLSPDRLRVLLHPISSPESKVSDNTIEDSSMKVNSNHTTDHELWHIRDHTHGKWKEAKILYTFKGPHKIVFEGIPKEITDPIRTYRGYIAIDGIERRDGNNCKGFCTFDAGFCDWSNENGDDFDWSLSRGSHDSSTGPAQDSSSFNTGEMAGGYSFIDSSYPRRPGDAARLASSIFNATEMDSPMCMRFWFHMFGTGIGALRVLVRQVDNKKTKEAWSLSGEAGNAWFRGEVSISSYERFQIIFEGIVGFQNMGDIAIDDISFTSGACPVAPQVANPSSGDCTFEVDECGWTNSGARERTDDIDWERTSSQDPRYRLRLHVHGNKANTDNGFFLGLGRPELKRTGSTAQFVSKEFEGSENPRCISFWYLMHEPFIDNTGPSLGVLKVLLRTKGDLGNDINTPIWQLYNYQGVEWNLGQAMIMESKRYRVVFEGTWGPNRASGSIAFDDIAFYDGPCSMKPSSASVRAEDCSFERELCGWLNRTAIGQNITWQTAYISHRPANLPDRTFGSSGGYVYFDIFNTNQKQSAVRLVSPTVQLRDNESSLCFTFWYAAFGASDTTMLSVKLGNSKDDMGDSESETIWKLTAKGLDTSRPVWLPAQVNVANSREFRIILEGQASNGGFAVDDIRFQSGQCPIRPPEAALAKRLNNGA